MYFNRYTTPDDSVDEPLRYVGLPSSPWRI